MPLQYRRPGVYLEESLLVNPAESSGAVTVACFIGVAQQGPINEPTLVESWSDFVSKFGNFSPFAVPDDGATPQPPAISYLPYSVYSFFQSGGRTAYIIRCVPTTAGKGGDPAEVVVNGSDDLGDPLDAFTIVARSVGTWGNAIKYEVATAPPDSLGNIGFGLRVLITNANGADEVAENFNDLSLTGFAGTRRVDVAVNDPYSGSQYIAISGVNTAQPGPEPTSDAVSLAGGVDPALPDSTDLKNSAQLANKVEGPIALNIAGFLTDATKLTSPEGYDSVYVGSSVGANHFPDRQDIFIINDNAPPRIPQQPSSAYKSAIQASDMLGTPPGDSYVASYGPWIIVPDPQSVGKTMAIPPGGGVMGVMARIDATVGVFRAPAGVIAGISNAVGVQTKFTDTELGDLNATNINIIRSVPGAGIAIMGARTRKSIGTDKYVSARRTLIFVKEVLKRSTQFAVFENNDQRLWAALRMSADRILRPLWESGGLRGNNPSEAYYIRCDEFINNPQVIASGEVRMEIGVALEYPAEFIVIRITQFDRATYSTEVQPIA